MKNRVELRNSAKETRVYFKRHDVGEPVIPEVYPLSMSDSVCRGVDSHPYFHC